jgi:hypothetical protein
MTPTCCHPTERFTGGCDPGPPIRVMSGPAGQGVGDGAFGDLPPKRVG